MTTEPDNLDPVIDATALVTRAVMRVENPLWKLELAAHSAMGFSAEAVSNRGLANSLAQIAASFIALASLFWALARHGGTSPSTASKTLAASQTVFAVHGEDSTRTRHLRHALAEHGQAEKPILLLGRPAATTAIASDSFDPARTVSGASYLRPASIGTAIACLPRACALLGIGIRETSRYCGRLHFRDRVAIAFRITLGAAHARWWSSAAPDRPVRHALFAHTGNADSSQLEQAMQRDGVRTVHLVHGTNIGWAFAGYSDVAVFPSGADANLGESLPGYGRCVHLPLDRPRVSAGNGDWALLTSYTHLQHPAFPETGSRPDCELVRWVRAAADDAGQDPARVFWRPHPQIDLVPAPERERLEQAIKEAGFTRWPADLPYEALGKFSVVVTTPSTVLTDGLRLGQPVVVASLTPLQRDLLYAVHPLLAQSEEKLRLIIARLHDPEHRQSLFAKSWNTIRPGARTRIEALISMDD